MGEEDEVASLLCAPGLDTTTANWPRFRDFLLGGDEYHPVDRDLAARIEEYVPDTAAQAQGERIFLSRVIRFLAGEMGITQFLDIEAGYPTVDNTHEIAHRINPDCTTAYTANDPLVLAHARALLTSDPGNGDTAHLDADLRDPNRILDHARHVLDLSRPVAIIMIAALWHITDDPHATQILNQLRDTTPAGSFLALTHQTTQANEKRAAKAVDLWNQNGRPRGTTRTPAQIENLLGQAGWDLAEPGVVMCTRWRPETDLVELGETDQFAALARSP